MTGRPARTVSVSTHAGRWSDPPVAHAAAVADGHHQAAAADGLERGLGDIVAANLTITNARLAQVDFSDPFLSDVSELVGTMVLPEHEASRSRAG